MTWNWDVKATTKPVMADDFVSRSANLMCYLLHNISYNQLYAGPLVDVVWRLKQNLLSMPRSLNAGAITIGFDVKSELSESFRRMEVALKGDQTVILREFFEKHYRSEDPAIYAKQLEFISAIEYLHRSATNGEMAVFCTPFMAFQRATSPSKPLDYLLHTKPFLDVLGKYTLFDLHTYHEPLNPDGSKGPIRTAVAKGRADGILNFLTTSGVKEDEVYITTPPSNYRTCSGGHCVSTTLSSWCNEDENGNCTVAGG